MKDLNTISRGEVFYIKSTFDSIGSEQRSGRPAVVVSNNINNRNSSCVEICFMTLKEKTNLPTHVIVSKGACINSTVLCEQVTTVSKERLGDYMCRLPDEDMDLVDKALIESLGLNYIVGKNSSAPVTSTPACEELLNATPDSIRKELDKLRAENNAYYTENKELIVARNNLTDKVQKAEAYFKEAEMYKRMYEDLLDRIMKRG